MGFCILASALVFDKCPKRVEQLSKRMIGILKQNKRQKLSGFECSHQHDLGVFNINNKVEGKFRIDNRPLDYTMKFVVSLTNLKQVKKLEAKLCGLDGAMKKKVLTKGVKIMSSKVTGVQRKDLKFSAQGKKGYCLKIQAPLVGLKETVEKRSIL